jgi:hypothetical protein
VILRDDGVNITFTISHRDDPSEAKTVTFRSLFRGRTNYVALEGPSAGAVLVDRVEISQDLTTRSFSSYSDFADLVVDSRERLRLELELLEHLAPAGAELIMQDDFQGETLDATRWTTLGEVQLQDGHVQLGLPNPDGHIDTWKERPYLLTSKPIAVKSGPLTILGKISFAKNFLSGYGASFAVMTRASNQPGHASGWEKFVLRQGVRANFWPAAWDTQHSLEVHEFLAPDSIELLSTQGVKVDPNVQSYLFRAIDDGQSIELTILDPVRPEQPMTIHSTTTLVNDQGYVGFESTWGSPVTLDSIRIYQTGSSASSTTTVNQHD